MSVENLKETNSYSEIHASAVENSSPKAKEEEGEGSLLEINGTLVLIVISFVIFTILMQKIFYGPIFRIRKKREEFIGEIFKETESAQTKSAELTSEYDEKIKEVKKQVFENTKIKISSAEAQKLNIINAKKQIMSELLNKKREEILDEKHSVLNALQKQVDSYALEITKKVLGADIVCMRNNTD